MEGQAEQLARLRAANAENRARAASMRAVLTPGMLLWAPLGGGWTIGQVFEHLVMAHESYHARLRAQIERGRAAAAVSAAAPESSIVLPDTPAASIAPFDGARPDFAWKPSLMGGWLASSLVKPGRMSAPGSYQPAPQPRPDVVGAYLKRLDETAALLDASAELEWQRLRLTSPVTLIIRMNVGDAFTILANHDTRHMKQIERLRGQVGFPRPR